MRISEGACVSTFTETVDVIVSPKLFLTIKVIVATPVADVTGVLSWPI